MKNSHPSTRQRRRNPVSRMPKPRAGKHKGPGLPEDVSAIRKEIRALFDLRDDRGRRLGSIECGVYAFYDYDGEPIYVGQTLEGFSDRISRHLTGQRSDAVAMNVLDPFEVAEVRLWPLDLQHLDRAEFTLFQKVIAESKLRVVLNEKLPTELPTVDLPKSYGRKIIPDRLYPQRKHPDVRIARRASTIASLARVISERKVKPDLRRVLLAQARRLELLSKQRLKDFEGVADEEGNNGTD